MAAVAVPLLVGNVFRRAARRTPNRFAASLAGRSLTFLEVETVAARLAEVLHQRGVGPGDRVGWWGDTTIDAVPLFAALAQMGAVFAPINARLAAEEAAPVLELADPALVVTDKSRQADGDATLEELLEAAAGADPSPRSVSVDERDPHVIFFTSGSTGRSKGVVLSHRANVLRTMPGNAPTLAGPTVCMFPLFHMAAWSIALGCWQAGDEVAFVDQTDAATLLGTVEARRARRLYAIPAVWGRILAELSGDPSAYDLHTLQEADTGTSATPPELISALRDALPHTVTRVMYGSTEAGAAATLGSEDLERKPGSVGLPAAGVELELAESGEVLVRSPFLMSGYFRNEEATAIALADGWYHTGDLGVLDDEGYLSIVGRASDLIRTGGEAVAPPEVEAAVASHPAVAETAVVGLADPEWGERVCAVVVLRPGSELDLDDLRRYLSGRLASFKHPRKLVVTRELPRTAATGQIQRTLLVEQLSLGDMRE
ncbi:MAG TPA: AMP-binding protein [Acidimicrobiales bacterium]|nr:AMP-binding protein [Acidimicrobiales bacterium]